jgi:hypothetical protein
MKTHSILFFGFLILFILFMFSQNNLIKTPSQEGFSLLANPSKYPLADETPILSDSYSFTGNKTVNQNTSRDIWWKYPIFKLGSYLQITNNLKYPRNPDNGTSITPDFSGVLYKDKRQKGNVATLLSGAPEVTSDSVRVGYYTTNNNLFMGQQLGPELPAF